MPDQTHQTSKIQQLLDQKPVHKILGAAIEDQYSKPIKSWSQEDFTLQGIQVVHRKIRNQLRTVERSFKITLDENLKKHQQILKEELSFLEELASQIIGKRL